MKTFFGILFCCSLFIGCNNAASSDSDYKSPDSLAKVPAGAQATAPITDTPFKPVLQQHVPLSNTVNTGTNTLPSTNTITTATTAVPATAQQNTSATKPGMNPPHGEPGHRCDISVGAPLNSQPTTTKTTTISQPAMTSTAVATPAPKPQKTAPGMNPPHGEPGHRCDISVGAPLNSAPNKAAESNTSTNPATNPLIHPPVLNMPQTDSSKK